MSSTITDTVSAYLKQPYSRMILPETDGTFRGEILEFPGCIATGDNPQETFAALEDAATSWLEAALENGQAIPEPVDNSAFSGRMVLRLPKSLHKKASRLAQRDGVSLNQFIVAGLAEHVGERRHSPCDLIDPRERKMLHGEPEYRRRARQKAADDKETAERERDKTSQDAKVMNIIRAIEGIVQELRRGEDEDAPKNKSDRRRHWWEIRGLWAAALVGVAAIIIGNWDAHKQREVMVHQAEIASDTEAKQLRAYVFANVITPITDPAPGIKVYSVIFSNGGATPAYDLAYGLHAGYVPTMVPIETNDDLRVAHKPRPSVPGEYLFKQHTKQYSSKPFVLDQQQSAAIANGSGGIIFYGTMTYKDIFGCWRFTSFCVNFFSQQGAPPGQYECSAHNDVDDPNKCDKD